MLAQDARNLLTRLRLLRLDYLGHTRRILSIIGHSRNWIGRRPPAENLWKKSGRPVCGTNGVHLVLLRFCSLVRRFADVGASVGYRLLWFRCHSLAGFNAIARCARLGGMETDLSQCLVAYAAGKKAGTHWLVFQKGCA